jgi:hypothetical protein
MVRRLRWRLRVQTGYEAIECVEHDFKDLIMSFKSPALLKPQTLVRGSSRNVGVDVEVDVSLNALLYVA